MTNSNEEPGAVGLGVKLDRLHRALQPGERGHGDPRGQSVDEDLVGCHAVHLGHDGCEVVSQRLPHYLRYRLCVKNKLFNFVQIIFLLKNPQF